jgi:hypothetical protein
MIDAHTGRIRRARQNSLPRPERTVRQLPGNAVRRHFDLAHLDAARAAFRPNAAQPQVVLACSIYLPFEASCQVLNGPTHE